MVDDVWPDSGIIHPDERDYGLSLNDDKWGTGLSSSLGWKVVPTSAGATKYLSRNIRVDEEGKARLAGQQHDGSQAQKNCLTETIVRFPAAPLYRIPREK